MKTNAAQAQIVGSSCCVCGESDARALVDVKLVGGAWTTLCGTHALIHRRARGSARDVSALRELLRDRRGAGDRRKGDADELGAVLVQAFNGERRKSNRRGV